MGRGGRKTLLALLLVCSAGVSVNGQKKFLEKIFPKKSSSQQSAVTDRPKTGRLAFGFIVPLRTAKIKFYF
jgi:hypothetical protein